MFVATMDTEKFDWMALGNTEEEARLAVARAFHVHLERARQQEIDLGWHQQDADASDALEVFYARTDIGRVTDPDLSDDEYLAAVLDEYYSINVDELQPGECMRDHWVVPIK